jgi:retron-type reverse transcriptase
VAISQKIAVSNNSLLFGRAMAVKRAISNKGKNTPGIDGAVWIPDKANFKRST